jgi:osmotically-inducible protein OsmY
MAEPRIVTEASMSIFTDGDQLKTKRNESKVDVEETARVRLQTSPYRAIRRISCEFDAGVLVLQGRVATFHYKQLAQVAVSEIEGVTRIRNNVEVESP